MKRGKNSVSVACTLELINLIKTHAGKEDQNEGFWLIKRLLTKDKEFKEQFIEKYGKDTYEETLNHYSKTNLEQRAERKLKEEEKRIREEAKSKIEELRTNAYAKQSEVASDKLNSEKQKNEKAKLLLEKRKVEEAIRVNQKFLNSENEQTRKIAQKQLKKAKARLEEITARLEQLEKRGI